VNRAAHFLLRRGLKPQEKFNLHLGNCPEFLVFWLAAARTGTVMVPTNPVSTADEMAYILAHSEARLSITEPRYAEACHAGAAPLDVIDVRPLEPLLEGLPDTPPEVAVVASDEISMQYTSGTTSKQAWMDQEGYFFFVDRAKDMIKRAGENVSASEVEDVLKQHPAVFDAAVVAVPDPLRDQAIKAHVILKEGVRCDGDELIAWCAGRLSKFKVPELIEFRDAFPRTSVGKIQKHLF
jgi:acyl-CoA synthetase (AMP-forming)/AMP-acid ligase II